MSIVESLKAANPARESSKNTIVLPRGDGISLEATVFAPPERPRNLVLISAATGVPQRFYFGYAEHLAELGWACVTYDYFGVACSRPVSRRWLDVGLQTWVEDIEAVLRFCEQRFRDVPITLLGHSVGGLVSLLAPISTSVRRVVTVAAQPSYWKDWPLRVRFTRLSKWHVLYPALTAVWGYFPGSRFGLGEDLPSRFVMEWASLCWSAERWKKIWMRPDRLRGYPHPVIAVGITDDTIGTPRALQRLHSLLPPANVTYRWLSAAEHGVRDIGHFDLFRRRLSQLWPLLDEEL